MNKYHPGSGLLVSEYFQPLDFNTILVKDEVNVNMQRMNSLRRSLRESFRRKKDSGPESSKPHQWQADEEAVRAGSCTFHVKVYYKIGLDFMSIVEKRQ